MEAARLGPDRRAAALKRLSSETFDILIIGGGVTGAGCAVDAATRGLSVAMIEQRDWASGTSSRSSKLIHGGIRYLEQLDFPLVREALREQTLMLETLCPHLIRPVPFLFPLRHRVWERAYVGAGLLLYDTIGGRRALPRHRHLSRTGMLQFFPGLRGDRLVGAIQYWDAQVDDARHTLMLARTAALHGAAVASSARAVALLHHGGRVSGARVRDLEGGQDLEIRARQVINAAGVWSDRVQSLAGGGSIRLRISKGIHLVVPRERIAGEAGLVLRTPSSVLFLIPWQRHWIIGTTDTDWKLDLAHPAASRRDIDYLLGTVNAILAEPLRTEDIEGVYAGLRPLLQGESDATSQLSRKHAVSRSPAGLITVAGGKYTTYRVMAKDAVDEAVRAFVEAAPECRTNRVPLLGASGYSELWESRAELSRETGLGTERIEHLLSRYGSCLTELLSLVRERPDLARPLDGAEAYLRVEALYAASHEAALHLDDVLTRRTRISIETFDRGVRAASSVAELMGEVLGWDAATRDRELWHYRARVAAERESQEQPDDRTADAARLGAPDVRMGASDR